MTDKLQAILKKGELLINIVTSARYSPEIRAEALTRMRENVIIFHRLKKELPQ